MERISFVRGEKPSTTTRILRKNIKEFDVCFSCKNYFDKYFLEIEHTIPVCIGGDIKNYKFLCERCHKKKDRKDKIIINFLKKEGFLVKITTNQYETPITKEELIEIYNFLFNKLDRLDRLDSIS